MSAAHADINKPHDAEKQKETVPQLCIQNGTAQEAPHFPQGTIVITSPVTQHEAYECCGARVQAAQQQHWRAVQLLPLEQRVEDVLEGIGLCEASH